MATTCEPVPPGDPLDCRLWGLMWVKTQDGRTIMLWMPAEDVEGETQLCAHARAQRFLASPKIIDTVVLPADENPNFPNGAWNHKSRRDSPFK
jgi:hypothetical protein